MSFHHPSSDEEPENGSPDFSFDFVALPDHLDAGQRWSTWPAVEPLMRGPAPLPDWVVTASGAVDTDLGVLKGGKEADVFLLERQDLLHPDDAVVMAAKRYRASGHRNFHRAAAYTEGRSVKRSRDQRALDRRSTWGRTVAATEWAVSEWSALLRCWELGLPVPYPVQCDGTEILMEWIQHDGETAPRLTGLRPDRTLLDEWYAQVRDVLHTLAGAGLVHGDLSPYNVLAAGDRLVVIDLPQVVDLAGNSRAGEFLRRDCTNMAAWFTSRGLEVDAEELFADVVTRAW
ncbi:serine protein kinase RIO [Nocardioides jishulii]|uniref:non-specific serine/threonine protein kinase n=1 Tax=Nocardioides jishulii TaxID=2575440 RepID=A0A4U2YLT3_9ACTN|nr:RIO1 family regulatory kinase/ATPase [Nocardioides jishulii]QCX27073.1 serine/threonine protein kinase [Nocardioides jishulii]TKI61555.1 serine/threonine protein kinase [Nocardioides jishulii]